MTGATWRSAFVAALFAIHPLRVESVAWISERKDVLSGLFFMLTLGAYLQYVRRPASLTRYLIVVLIFACGLMCKPMLVTLPFVLLLLDYWPLNRLSQSSPAGKFVVNRHVIAEKIPLLVLSLAFCAAILLVPKGKGSTGQIFSTEWIPFRTRMAEAPVWVVIYLGQMFRPVGLSVVYTHFENALLWWPAAVALLLLLSLGIFHLRKKHPALWMGWLWNLGMLVPVIGIVQISRHAQADHYNYLPQIGIYIGLTWLAADWALEYRRRRAALSVAAGAVLCVLTLVSCKQTSYWRNNIILWTHALECTTDNFVAHYNLGLALLQQGRTGEAISHFREALWIEPSHDQAHYNLGVALQRQGRAQDAIAQYREALLINPAYGEARGNLGEALFQNGQTEEAISQYREALQINPASGEARYNLGVALFRQGRTQEAIAQYREALAINSAIPGLHNNFGVALHAQGLSGEAIAQYREELRMDPRDADVHCNLANALIEEGKAGDAIMEYDEALQINPSLPKAHNNLGLVLLQQGRTGEAIPHFREALRIDPAYENARTNLDAAMLRQKQDGESIARYREALRVDPGNAAAHCNLGNALLRQGNAGEAVAEAQKALDLQPANPSFLNNLAWMLATVPDPSLRNAAKAVELAGKASEATGGNNPLMLHTLAVAYAAAGEFPAAVQTAQKAVGAAEAQSNVGLADELRREIQLYQAGQPFENTR